MNLNPNNISSSLLDVMIDGREFESLIKYQYINVDIINEMVNSIPYNIKEIDVILVTPGGSADQVNNFVNALRPRFEKVNFIVLNMAMSAGTIFIMSGDEIIMSKQSKFGPIDPQIRNREGRFVPAQSILVTLEDIRKRGEERIKDNKNTNYK